MILLIDKLLWKFKGSCEIKTKDCTREQNSNLYSGNKMPPHST